MEPTKTKNLTNLQFNYSHEHEANTLTNKYSQLNNDKTNIL